MDSSTQVAGTAAFSKFMTVLQAVADAASPVAMADLVRVCGYPRGTVYRIVAALLQQGMIAETSAGGAGAGVRYGLGPRLLQLASRAWSQLDLRAALADDLQSLRDQTGETVHLAVPAGSEMIYIDKLEGPGPVRMASRVGGRLALHCTAAGKAYLAALPEAEADAILATLHLDARMPNTIARRDDLRQELARIRQRGYSVDDEENERGIVCYSVAIAGQGGRPLACVSVSTLQFRQQGGAQSRYIAPLIRLRDAAQARFSAWPAAGGAFSREDT
ncbi:IclR family transcriptional regulator [Bordetella bronchialis]|uniref:IclR family transcriptional regulator n=1 Tax=Bordetella bronchialis TaxID=463025 RepID=A0A193FE05_9BORD|nr:IclR family transcriptional regulator [Bordetella bronchialis]ANN65795.1 IclR family transcriptional regulator [Bordetella bronchialis]ANN70825.1 IclR family transcriptional regulator [Bordetella bronchialis]